MKAWVLNVGDEVLGGKTINTNCSYLSIRLNSIGIDVVRVIVVGDVEEDIVDVVSEFKDNNIDILITTGGLGPTHDDFTKEVVCKCLHKELVLNDDAKKLLDNYFGHDYAKCNIKQAYFPKDAIIIPNNVGTADGAIVGYEKKIIAILVGPPFELKPMVDDSLIPYLINKTNTNYLYKNYHVMGQGESYFEDYLKDLYHKYLGLVNIAPYASLGLVRYELKAKEKDKSFFEKAINDFEELMSEFIISSSSSTEPLYIEEVIVNILKEKHYKISFSESCTGGLLCATLINVSGASNVIEESLVTYANKAKCKYLNVKEETIEEYNVVSKEVVQEMAEGLYKLTNSDVCIATSGISGPTGGTEDRPVGLVHYAIKIKGKIYLENKVFKGNRDMIRTRSVRWILYRLFRLLNSKN